MYFDPVLMMCENIVLMEEEEPKVRDCARGLDASLVKALSRKVSTLMVESQQQVHCTVTIIIPTNSLRGEGCVTVIHYLWWY